MVGTLNWLLENVNVILNLKIARRTTGAKGSYLLAGFLQVSKTYFESLYQVSNKSLTNL
jgi:hypothetical protein